MFGRNTELRRGQSRKLAVEALGLKHADMYAVPNGPREKIKRRNESRMIEKKKRRKRWGHQTSLEKRLPEYMTFIWSCRAMRLLLDVARVVVRGIAELGSKGLETLLIL